MPLGPDVKYRWKTEPNGTKIRLAFKGDTVIEVKKKGGTAHLLKNKATEKLKDK